MPVTPNYATNPGETNLDHEHKLDVFYRHFHQAHPFLVPRSYYTAQHYPLYLDSLVGQIAARYAIPSYGRTNHREKFDTTLVSGTEDHTVARVQALLIAGIVLHADHEPHDAHRCISQGMQVAKALGMNDPNFARSYALEADTVMPAVTEESVRRTWWELYIIDVYLAGLHRRRRCAEDHVLKHPLLPCSEAQFETIDISSLLIAQPLQAFQDRVFDSDRGGLRFSPYSYRIEAAQILERSLALVAASDRDHDSVQAVDNAVVSWKYNLPAQYSEVISPSGEVDQMLFQAHCFISCASILLHFPRSELPATVPSTAGITGAQEYRRLLPTSAQHTAKAIAASQEISNLATIPCSVDQHSPLFACSLILGCIVQLSAACIHVHVCGHQCLQQHRDRVVLIFGILQSMSQQWTVASNALQRLQPVARMIFSPPEPPRGAADIPHTDGIAQSNIDASEGNDAGVIPWFDLLEMDELPDLFAG